MKISQMLVLVSALSLTGVSFGCCGTVGFYNTTGHSLDVRVTTPNVKEDVALKPGETKDITLTGAQISKVKVEAISNGQTKACNVDKSMLKQSTIDPKNNVQIKLSGWDTNFNCATKIVPK